MSLKTLKLLSLLVLALAISVAVVGVPSVQASGGPRLKVGISSAILVTNGTKVTSKITVGSMPAFNSFDIIIKVDPLVLRAKLINITGGILPAPIIDINCIDGAGFHCDAKDGVGVAHLAAHSSLSTTLSKGFLFKVGWKAVNGVGSFGTKGTTITAPCQLIALNGNPIPNISVTTATYGTVPASAQPGATFSANQTAITIKANATHSVTINVLSVNGFSGIVSLSASPSSSSLTVKPSLTLASCNCGAQPSAQLAISPTKLGTFSVIVTGRIGLTIIGVVSITVTSD